MKAGLDRAREKGTKSGKPIGRPGLDDAVRQGILQARAAGKSFRQTAKDCGVALSTVQKVMKESARLSNGLQSASALAKNAG